MNWLSKTIGRRALARHPGANNCLCEECLTLRCVIARLFQIRTLMIGLHSTEYTYEGFIIVSILLKKIRQWIMVICFRCVKWLNFHILARSQARKCIWNLVVPSFVWPYETLVHCHPSIFAFWFRNTVGGQLAALTTGRTDNRPNDGQLTELVSRTISYS